MLHRRLAVQFSSFAAVRACATTSTTPSAGPAAAVSAGASPDASSAPKQLRREQSAFLDKFRAKLAAADEADQDLDAFVERQAAEEAAAAGIERRATPLSMEVPKVPLVKRGQERLPPWLKMQMAKGPNRRPKYNKIKAAMRGKKLATVCEEAKCPNIGECWGGGDDPDGTATATIMMMGDTCTRGCRFCSIKTSRAPPPLDPEEPDHVAQAVGDMGVEYIVVTMVDRDDLPDGGAAHVAKTMRRIKEVTPSMLIEVLAGDFRGDCDHVGIVADSGVDCYAHNIECVERVTSRVRDRRANYRQSLRMLEHARSMRPDLVTKSSIMLGVGEEEAEVRQTLRDLREAGVQAVTLGQYLQPASTRMKVSRYAHPLEFEMWEKEALDMGFLYCASGPMVRSSYRAGEYFMANIVRARRAAAAAGGKPVDPAAAGL